MAKRILTVGLHIRHKARLHGRLADVEFYSASSASEALTLLDGKESFDLLIVDEALEGSGSFLQRIKPLKIPTIFCAESEKSTGFMRSLIVDLKVSAVLVKPVDPDEMVRKASEMLSVERTLEEIDDPVQEEMRARLAALWEKFGPANRERLQWLKSQISDLLEGFDKDEAARREIEREAHKMVGALGTFGFPNATVLAREIELHASPSNGPRELDAAQLLHWAQAIELELNKAPRSRPAVETETGDPRVLVVSENHELVRQLAAVRLEARSLKVLRASSWIKARESWILRAPELVVLDLCGEASEERQTLLHSVAARLSTIPVLVLLPRDVWSQPEALSRFAGFPVLFHPFQPELLESTVVKLLSDDNRPKPKVLAVDDDPQILDALEAILRPLKLELTTLADPLEFWDTLESCSPDLLILDIDMPYLSGIELCRGVRSSARWYELPVLFLSASNDAESLTRIFSVGADDFVPKPFGGPELATRVVNRLVRSSRTPAQEGGEELRSGLEGLRDVLAEERWKESPIVLALVRVRNDEKLVRRHGSASVIRMNRLLGARLAERLRGLGAVARWRSHEYLVALPEQTLDGGTHLLSSLLSEEEVTAFPLGQEQQMRLQVVAGVTSMAHPDESLEAALRQCELCLEGVCAEGSSIVRAHEMAAPSPTATPRERCQLLILEPDPATGEAVKSLFEERGFITVWEPDTASAVSRLTADPPSLEARAVFISTGGLQLLQKLGPATRLMNVVVAVSTEAELVKAFDGGAYDCIEKPSTVGTLVKRLERAVGT